MRVIFKCLAMVIVLCGAGSTLAGAATVSNLSFKDADIKVVLQAITQMAKSDNKNINIVSAPGVAGTVTIDLTQVNWQTALDVICRTYSLDTYRQNNVILVTPIGPNGSIAKSEIHVKAVTLKFIDANDALKAITPILSSSGKTSVLETNGQSGWEFGIQSAGQQSQSGIRAGVTDKKLKRTKVLVVSDSSDRLDQISALLDQLDVMPKQILIKARILEVDHQFAKDLGVDWGTGSTGATSTTLQPVNSTSNTQFATHSLATVTPSTFVPQTTGLTTANSGFQFLFKQIQGTQYEVILHALEENTKTNELSAPILTTLNNQEAKILVGTQFPIIQTQVNTTSTLSEVVGGSLQYYQNIGIQLNVVPQIWGEEENFINLIVHPIVSSSSSNASINDSTGASIISYPIIDTREAETQLVIPNGGTVMMGGLIKDVKNDQIVGVPFLSRIPYIGKLFERHVKNVNKIDLVIFITAQIIVPGEQVSPTIINTSAVEKHFPAKR